MANPNPSKSESVSSRIHDAADRFAQQAGKPEVQEHLKETIDEASEAMGDFLNDASAWLKDNGGKAAAVAAAAAAMGVIGYFIGRNAKPNLGDIQDI